MTTPPLCTACKKPLAPGDRFCLACGAPVLSTSQRAASSGTELLVPLPMDVEPPPPEHAPAGGKGKAVVAAALLLALGAGGWWFLSRRAPSPATATAAAPGAPATPKPEAAQPVPPPAPPAQAAPAPAAPAQGPAQLVLTDIPFGATILVDGHPMNGASFSLPAGPHVIAMRAAGYRPVEDTVTLQPGQRTELALHPQVAGH